MGERNFGLDSLKSMNRDMEEKGIVLRELSCRTAAELPAPVLPDCRRIAAGLLPDLPASTAVQLQEYPRRSRQKASAAVQFPEYTAGAAGLTPKLRRRPDGFGGGRTASTAARLPPKPRRG